MSLVSDVMTSLFGGGGGGGGGGGSDALLDWFRDEKEEQEQLGEREQAQADAFAILRRDELADRPGYSGLVRVGDAVERSDETLAAEMDALAADDPTRLAYQDALAKEAEQTATYERTASGLQFKAEDAFADLEERIAEGDLDALTSELGTLSQQYGFYDAGGLLVKIQTERKRRAEAKARAEAANANQYTGG